MERRPTKPISGKVPYYLFCLFFFLLVVVSIAPLRKHTDYCSKHEMIWSYGVRPIRKSGLPKTMFSRSLRKKNSTPHTQPEPGLPRGQSIYIIFTNHMSRDFVLVGGTAYLHIRILWAGDYIMSHFNDLIRVINLVFATNLHSIQNGL